MLLALASPPPPAPELKNLFRMELKVLHYWITMDWIDWESARIGSIIDMYMYN
jgi:hypothetical protein